jgi:hypothetical protein
MQTPKGQLEADLWPEHLTTQVVPGLHSLKPSSSERAATPPRLQAAPASCIMCSLHLQQWLVRQWRLSTTKVLLSQHSGTLFK